MTAVDRGDSTPDAQDRPLALAEEVTQEDVDAALAAATPTDAVVEVRDIPGVHTAAHSGDVEEWRAIRQRTLSATAATTVMGTNPFQSIMDLWRERMEGFKPTFSRFSLTIMNYGTLAEPELVKHANAWVATQPDNEPFVLTHGYVLAADDDRFGCTPDGWRHVVNNREDGTREQDVRLELLELKTGSKTWRKTPRSKPVVPPNYIDQIQWQMMVTGAHRVLAVQRVVERDRQGNVVKIVGHNEVWVERDDKRIAALIEAVNAYLEDERNLVPPMTHVDIEDQFDDAPEVTAEKRVIRETLATIRQADAILAETRYTDAVKMRADAADSLKGILARRPARQVITTDGRTGATLSRSTRNGYDVKLLTEKQRERIHTTTTVNTLRVSAQGEE